MTEAREHNEVSSDKAVLFDAMPLCDEVKRALADVFRSDTAFLPYEE